MRISSNSFPTLLVQELNTLTNRQSRLQSQIATGQRIELPEDNPAALQRVLDLQGESQRLGQYKLNINYLKEEGDAAYNVLRNLKSISDRAGEIATLADNSKSPEELKTYGLELSQLIKQGVQLMNSKLRGSQLFGGTRSDITSFSVAQGADGAVQTVTYEGNTSVNEAEIAEGGLFSVQIVGANTTGSGPRGLITDSRFGADFFNHLISLQNHLLQNDTASISAQDQSALRKDEENILFHIGTNGAMQSRLDAALNLTDARLEGTNKLVSNEVDADLSESLVQLSRTQTAYQAALQSAATVMKISLMDYLR